MNGIDWGGYREDFRRCAQKSGFERQLIAETRSGPIEAWTRDTGGRTVYLSAGMHGDEPAAALALLEWMRSGEMSDELRWAVIPMLNPTGLERGTRDNADGVDLNRDYRARVTTEVAAHTGWLESQPVPDVFVSMHEDWEAKGFYLYEIRHGEDAPSVTREVLAAAREVFPLDGGPEIDGHEVREAGWIYHGKDPDEPEGWPEAIFLSHLGCPLSFTMETPSSAPLGRRIDCHLAVLRRVLSVWERAVRS